MRAFVVGSTGYTGRSVVGELRRRGHAVLAHVRPGSKTVARLAPRFTTAGVVLDGTPFVEGEMMATLATWGPTHVFACLGTTRARQRQGEPHASYESVDRDLTLLVHRAAADCGHRPTFVYLSSIGADRPAGNRYLRARHDVEVALAAGPLPWIVARPSFITGPDRDEARPGERYGAAVADAALGLLGALGGGELRDRYTSMTGPELGAALVGLAEDPRWLGRAVEAGDLRRLAAAVGAGAKPAG